MTKIARFRFAGEDRLGAVRGDDYVDLNKAYAQALGSRGVVGAVLVAEATLPTDALRFFQNGEAALKAVSEAVAYVGSISDADARRDGLLVAREFTKTLVPIPNPPKIICVARNYGKHAEEAGLQVSEIPILFARFAATQVADGDPIVVPAVSDQVDWEASWRS